MRKPGLVGPYSCFGNGALAHREINVTIDTLNHQLLPMEGNGSVFGKRTSLTALPASSTAGCLDVSPKLARLLFSVAASKTV
jgi:hypothetical protein